MKLPNYTEEQMNAMFAGSEPVKSSKPILESTIEYIRATKPKAEDCPIVELDGKLHYALSYNLFRPLDEEAIAKHRAEQPSANPEPEVIDLSLYEPVGASGNILRLKSA